jgi:hypothetical protein
MSGRRHRGLTATVNPRLSRCLDDGATAPSRCVRAHEMGEPTFIVDDLVDPLTAQTLAKRQSR